MYPNKEEKVLEKYGRDITEAVKSNKIDPVIGRDEEIRNLIRILSRKTKNNPVLIGEPGVGKTAIVEGLAGRIIKGDIPDTLKDKTVWELDLSALIARAKYQGEFEERFKAVLEEIEKSNGDIIMFIDEIHMITGAGSNSAMNVGNMLKPMLARGMIRLIGATTLNEYREFIEKDGALERRLQKIKVSEPNVVDTLTILRGLKERFEVFHGVNIKDSALVAAVNLSDRYITDRFLPDKAIDLVDEACATIKMQMNSVPTDLDEMNRSVMTLEIEREALKREKDPKSINRVKEIDEEMNNLKSEVDEYRKIWEEEKQLKNLINSKKEKLEKLKFELTQAEDSYDLEAAARLKHGEIPNLEMELSQLKLSMSSQVLSDTVDDEDIANVVSKWTNVPVTKLVGGEREKLLSLQENLKCRVKGQDEAIELVTNAIIRARSGIKDPSKPIGSETGGELTEAVRRNPYSIVLFDEIEKAHPDVFNILLQILDDGRITDSQGRTIDFKNTIIIMTSNLGSDIILNNENNRDELVMKLLKTTFRPELINRIDEIITFNSISESIAYEILERLINDLNKRLNYMLINITLTKEAKEKIITESFDKEFGARPVKRYITKHIENLISKYILDQEIIDNVELKIDVDNNEFVIKNV